MVSPLLSCFLSFWLIDFLPIVGEQHSLALGVVHVHDDVVAELVLRRGLEVDEVDLVQAGLGEHLGEVLLEEGLEVSQHLVAFDGLVPFDLVFEVEINLKIEKFH